MNVAKAHTHTSAAYTLVETEIHQCKDFMEQLSVLSVSMLLH